MCGFLGVVAEQPTTLGDSLQDSPRSQALLSREHPHGWGVALCVTGSPWRVDKYAPPVGSNARLAEIAASEPAEVLLAHVRQRTVGRVCMANTPPFRRDSWVFAHNGTVEDMEFLRRRTSSRRAREVEGDSDSELLFAYLLSCLDAAAGQERAGEDRVDITLTWVVREMCEHGATGSFNFLISDGNALYAYRRGKPLFFLQRRRSRTPSSAVPAAILVASEPLTDEPWQQLSDGALLRVSRRPLPDWRLLERGEAPDPPGSRPELPFTD